MAGRRVAAVPSGRSHTAPTSGDTKHTKRNRRVQTGQLPLDSVIQQSIPVLRRNVRETICERLADRDVRLQQIPEKYFEFLLPRKTTHAEIWDRLLSFPMLVSDIELEEILDLKRSTANSPPPPPGSCIYYFRSIGVTVSQLLAVEANWAAKGLHFEEMDHWKEMTSYVLDKDEIVYVRYAGMSERVTGWQRFADDLVQRTDGVYGKFITALSEIDPAIITDSVSVFEFDRTMTGAPRDQNQVIIALDSASIDWPERATIALLGPQTLLNRQIGGKNVSYQPEDRDAIQFQKLETHAFRKLEALLQTSDFASPSNNMRFRANKWIAKVRTLGEEHKDDLGTRELPMSEHMEEVWAAQATPSTLFGHVICTWVGDYCPLSGMYHPALVWEQPARGIRYLKNTLCSMAGLEKDIPRWYESDLDDIAMSGMFPWIDYQYTPKREAHREKSAELLRQYFETFKPLIAITFERRTSGVVRTNFVSLWDAHDFMPDVGVPQIQYWTHPGEVTGAGSKAIKASNQPEEDDAFIQIPLFHPGSDRYTSGSSQLRRMTFISTWSVVLMVDVTLRMLEDGHRPDQFEDGRFGFCEAMLTEYRKRWEASGCDEYLEQAKTELKDHFFKNTGTMWHKEPERAHKKEFDGTEVPVNQSGHVQLYWKLQNKTERVVIQGGRSGTVCPPKGATGNDKIRTVHFVPEGVDIRNHAGESMRYPRYKHDYTNPTFPGHILREKLGEKGMELLPQLWSLETGLDFDESFPAEGADPAACVLCKKNNVLCDKNKPACKRCLSKSVKCNYDPPAAGGSSKSATTATTTDQSSSSKPKPSTSAGQSKFGTMPSKTGQSASSKLGFDLVPAKRPAPPSSTTPTGTTRKLGRRMAAGGPNTPMSQTTALMGTTVTQAGEDTPMTGTAATTTGALTPGYTGKGRGRMDTPGNPSSIANKCFECRMQGVACIGGIPCARCTRLGKEDCHL